MTGRTRDGRAVDVCDYVFHFQNEQKQINKGFFVPSFFLIKDKIKEVMIKYNVARVYLYKSYAKGRQTAESDIDFYMISVIEDIEYFGFIEELRTALKKK